MVIEQFISRLPIAHTGWSVDNIMKNLAHDGSTSSLIGYIIWFSMCGIGLLICCYAIIQLIRGKWNPPSMFAPPPYYPSSKDKNG